MKRHALFVSSSVLTLILFTALALAGTFSDVDENDPHYTAIEYLVDEGVLEGYSDGTFLPDQTINRAELMKILIAGQGISPDADTYKDCFTDIADDWYAPYVCYAKEEGWVDGYSDGTFKPANDVLKVESIKMLLNSHGFGDEVASSASETSYTDVDLSEWYAPYLELAEEMNILEEPSGDNYYPGVPIQRGAAAENLYRVMTYTNNGSNESGEAQEWVFVDYAVGKNAENEGTQGNVYLNMADVLLLEDGTYRMVYSISEPGIGTAIKYAESDDALDWTVMGTILEGSGDEDDEEYFLSAPSVLPLPDGGYRLYYNVGPQGESGQAPQWHILSAISEDGINFEKESGVRLEIQAYDEDAELTFAGHGSYFIAEDGTYAVLFSGNSEENENAPSNIMLATSEDGLAWEIQGSVYEQWHDPIVLYKDGEYLMYASYLNDHFGTASSTDGLIWEESPSYFTLVDTESNELIEGSSEEGAGVGDLGGVVTEDDTIYLYSNFGFPSTDIAIFELKE